MCFGNRGFRSLASNVRDTTSLFLTVGTSTTGLMSTSHSNGQPQSWQAVNQRNYRKPLVLGYTIKSGNGLIKPATPQQTFWFCLLRAAQSLGWVKIRKPFFFCALLPGVSCSWSMYSKMHCAESYLFTLYSSWVNIRGEYCDYEVLLLSFYVTDASLIYCALVINAICAQSAGYGTKNNILH